MMSQQDDALRVMAAPKRYAVMLNARAKGWTGAVHEAVQRFVPNKDLFLTDDFRQAQTTIQRILESDYDVIFTGGGDGTVVYLANAIEEYIQAGKIKREDAPPVGVLRLGTGNAIASYLGAGDIIEDLQVLHAGSPLKVQSIDLIEDDKHRFPFAGFGWDADILNDYERIKAAVKDTALEGIATGLGGYVASVATRTIPRALTRRAHHATFTNLGEKAYALNEEGQITEEFGPGDVIYRGPVKITSTASIPYWGFKIRMFPYCNLRPGFFELRSYHGSVARVVTSLPDFWKGYMPSKVMGDWLVQEVRLEIEDGPSSYQVNGDAAGYRDQVVWKLAEHGTNLAIPLR